MRRPYSIKYTMARYRYYNIVILCHEKEQEQEQEQEQEYDSLRYYIVLYTIHCIHFTAFFKIASIHVAMTMII